jgi:hypothetical protein
MSFYPENLCNEFDDFLKNLYNLFPENKILNNIKIETAEEKIIRIEKLYKTLESSTNFNNFCKSKIKVFSHKENNTQKISESIFGSQLSLKKIFNNQPDDIKENLWRHLHTLLNIYLKQEIFNNPSKTLDDKISKLKESLSINKLQLGQTKKSLHNLFQTDKLNNSTNEMINDIFKSFEEVMTGEKKMDNILNLSNHLADKYEDKIKNKEIDFNGLFENLQTNIPGMENMKNIINPLMQMDSLIKDDDPKEKIIIDENFSTASVETGKLDDINEKPMIGSVINAVNKSGLVDMISSNNNESNLMNLLSDNNNSKLTNLFNGEGSNTLNKLLNIATKLKDTDLNNKEEINNILKNDLGLDVDKINEEMTTLLNQSS